MAPQEAELFEDQHPLIRSCPALNEIRLAQDIKDLTIEVKNGDVLHVHRIVLAARIPSLRASLSGPPGEENSVLRWPTAPLSLANALVQYVYTGRVEMTQDNVMGMIALARMLELPALVNWGTTFLTKRVNLENLPATWDFAKTFNIKLLTDTCIGLMKEHFVEFVPTELFVRLPAETVLSVLRSDHLSVGSEEEVVAAIARWTGAGACGQADDEKLKVHAPAMLKEVQWQLTTARSRDRLMKDYPTFGKSPECLQLMLQVERWIGAADKDKPARPFNLRRRLRPTIFIFGKDKDGQGKWSVLRADQHLQQAERVADMKTRRWYASYSVVGGELSESSASPLRRILSALDFLLVEVQHLCVRQHLVFCRKNIKQINQALRDFLVSDGRLCIRFSEREHFRCWRRTRDCCGLVDVDEFLVREGRWRERAPLAVRRQQHAAAVVKVHAADGEETVIGIFGGGFKEGDKWTRLASCEVYDVSRDRWHKLPDLPEKRAAPAAVCLPGDSRVFVFGGWDGSSRLASVVFCHLRADWRQEATSARTADFWQPAAAMRTARYDLAATPFRGAILVAGGHDGKRGGVVLTARRREPPRPVDRAGRHEAASLLVHSSHLRQCRLCSSRDVEEYLQHLTLLFDRFQQFGVTLHPATSLEFLSHLIDSNGIRPIPSKVAAIRDFPPPTSTRQLQRFLGMVNFYHRFLPNCADTILPLTSLLSGSKHTFELAPAALTSFEQVRTLLADATLLTHFHADTPISLMVDASNVAVGAVLQQSLPDSTVPLAFFSRKLSKAETRYSTFGRELLAAYLTLSPGIDLAEMAAEQRRVGSHCDEDVSGLQLQELPLTTGNGTILCDVSTPSHRPFVPPSSAVKFSPPCTIRLTLGVEQRQAGFRPLRLAWFSHVHLDIVGPLPLSNGCSYLLTCVDRFTMWPEAIPLPDIAAPTVVKGCTRIQTTTYHPTANGMVERFHRQLKASLCAAADPENWTDHLPLVLLGILSALKPDLDCYATELVFGATVRLPGGMISPTLRGTVEDPTNLLHRLRQFVRTLSPVPPRSTASPSYLEKDLTTCSHVYLRCDRVRRFLEPPYVGPFRVISRGTKNFRIQRGTSEEVVSVGRLKAAVPDTPPDEPCGPLPPAPPPRPSIPPSRILPLPSCPQTPTATTPTPTNNTVTASHIHTTPVPLVYITRSGRHVHFPDRLVTHAF
ncbi:hypothetical protein SprV_0702334700 [Sparganum proliferum]